MNRAKSARKYLAVTAVLLASTALAMPVMAQDSANTAPEADRANDPRGTIVVTATRREERVTDVPYNISAVSGDDIAAAQTFDSTELLRSIPGVGVVDQGGRNQGTVNMIRIRGLNVDSNALGDYATSSVATVSTYVNETPVFANFLLRDLERVEVLRGPQGTLYGSGSLGGTVRYITRDPELGDTGGYASAALSHVEGSGGVGYTLDAGLNLPLGDTLALRVIGAWVDYPGLTDYVNVYELDAAGNPVAPGGVLDPEASYRSVEDADTLEQWMVRATLLWQPSDDVSARLIYSRQEDEAGGRRAQTVGEDGYGRQYEANEIGSIQLEPSDREIDLAALEINVDLGFATLTSSSSYYDTSGGSTSENTGFYAQAGFLGFYYNYPRPMASAVRTYGDKAFVQEMRLVSNGGEMFDYVVGGFYRDQDIVSTQRSYLRGFKNWWDAFIPSAAGAVSGDEDFTYSRMESFKEVSVFGELTFHASDTIDLTIGARYFDNSSNNETFIDLPLYAGLFAPTTAVFEIGEDDVLFKGNLSWRFADEQLAYVTIAEGYRRGGSNAVPLTGAFAENPDWQIYTADTVVNYEAGLKGRIGDMTYDLSAFYIDWDDPQLNTATTYWGFFAVRNGGSARTYGLEAAIAGYLGSSVHYTLGYAYVDARLTSDFFSPDDVLLGAKDARLPGTPEHMLNGSLEYTTDVSADWSLFLRADGYYQSETRNAVGTSATFNVPLEGFAIMNATATLSNGPLSASLWLKNIFNEEGVTGLFTEAYMGTAPDLGYYGNGNKEFLSLPRTIGLTTTYVF